MVAVKPEPDHPAPLPTSPDLGLTFATFISVAVELERNRRQRLDERARDIQQTSATALGLIAAGGALLLGRDFELSFWARSTFVAALLLLLLAVIYAVIGSQVKAYGTASIDMMRKMISEHWNDAEPTARLLCAAIQTDTTASLREGNDTKAGWIEKALWWQVAGLVLLAATLGLAVFGI